MIQVYAMPKHTCPICHRDFSYETIAGAPDFPFCSRRCKLIDLGKWLDGKYVVPGGPEEDAADEDAEKKEDKE